MVGLFVALFIAQAAAPAAAPSACKIAGQPTLAILDVSASGLATEMPPVLSEALRNELVNTRCFKVQDAAQMRDILAMQKQNASEGCDESCMVESGRILQVAYLVITRVVVSGSGVAVLGRITNVETGTAVESATITRSATDLANLIDAMRAGGTALRRGRQKGRGRLLRGQSGRRG